MTCKKKCDKGKEYLQTSSMKVIHQKRVRRHTMKPMFNPMCMMGIILKWIAQKRNKRIQDKLVCYSIKYFRKLAEIDSFLDWPRRHSRTSNIAIIITLITLLLQSLC